MGNESTKHRSLFREIDQDKDGDLGLRELLEIQKLEGDIHKNVLTPSLLFRFDGDQDGSLDMRDFDLLMKHLKSIRKAKAAKKPPQSPKQEAEVWTAMDGRKASLMNFSRDDDTPLITGQRAEEDPAASPKEPASLQGSAVLIGDDKSSDPDKSSGSHHSMGCSDDDEEYLERRGAAPRKADQVGDEDDFVSQSEQRPGDDPFDEETARADEDVGDGEEIEEDEDEEGDGKAKSHEDADDEASHVVAVGEMAAEDPVDDDDEDGDVGFQSTVAQSPNTLGADSDSAQIIAESQMTLAKTLATPAGKKKYMKWLFRLADAEGKGRVNVEELAMILKALSLDGLAMSELMFEERMDRAHSSDYMDIARRIMAEFDTGKDGVLSEQEFLVLADLIVRKYAQRSVEDKVILDRYRLKRTLGSGAMGTVKLATNIKSGKSVAIKIINASEVSDFSKIDLEIKAMLMLRHPNVVRLYRVLESNDKVYLVMELCGGGTLADMVHIKPLSEPLARFYMRQLIPAIKYCHKQGVIHRDIKLENLLLTNRGNLKISDFGHAGIYRVGWDLFKTSLVGSLWHISPEQVSGTVYKGAKIDIWALGVVLYRLLSGGRPPFFSEIATEVLDMILNARFPPLANVSSDANDLIAKILVVDPGVRPSLRSISQHSWLVNGEESVPRLEAIDLILSPSTDVELQWAALCKAVTDLQVVYTVPMDSQRTLELHRMVCHYPTADMKFTITMLRVSSSPNDPPFFEFVIRAGETSEFQSLVQAIRKAHKATMNALTSGKVGGSSAQARAEHVPVPAVALRSSLFSTSIDSSEGDLRSSTAATSEMQSRSPPLSPHLVEVIAGHSPRSPPLTRSPASPKDRPLLWTSK